MADALSGLLSAGQKAAHGFAMMGSPGYRAGQIAQADIGYKKSLGKSRDVNTILSRIRMAGGLETEAGLRIAQTELMNNPELIRLMESIDPYRGFTEEQKLKSRLYERGVTSRPGATPYEASGLSPEEDRRYRESLRRGKLESFKPPWEREFPEEPTGALGGITPPARTPTPEPLPSTRTAQPEPLPPTSRELSPELQGLTDRFLDPNFLEPEPRPEPLPATKPVPRRPARRPIGRPYKQITLAETEPIFKKAKKNGIASSVIYSEAAKLKGLDLTREEMLTALDKLAEGFTAEDIIEYMKSK